MYISYNTTKLKFPSKINIRKWDLCFNLTSLVSLGKHKFKWRGKKSTTRVHILTLHFKKIFLDV
jgi:hypothetical protein